MHRSLYITVDGDDKQGAAAGAARAIKKGLNVLWAGYSFAPELHTCLFLKLEQLRVVLTIPTVFFTGSA